ncbi:hypothetical protein B0E53_06631 [Micromonospora sp. MH33]|nr:hypothetical protein B0E53_06631 [Micromonospora sp. MH33]
MASTVLITLTMPEGWLRWPMLDFTDPMPHQPRSSVSLVYTAERAATSIGSPSAVPVPCAST